MSTSKEKLFLKYVKDNNLFLVKQAVSYDNYLANTSDNVTLFKYIINIS